VFHIALPTLMMHGQTQIKFIVSCLPVASDSRHATNVRQSDESTPRWRNIHPLGHWFEWKFKCYFNNNNNNNNNAGFKILNLKGNIPKSKPTMPKFPNVETKVISKCWRVRKNCETRLSDSLWLSVLLHGTTRLPLEGFSWALIFDYSSKVCLENSSFFQSWLE
jgi:hypothetical protein